MSPDIRAIVFDTNVFGRTADLDGLLLRAWAAACQRGGASLWIPEVVVWELAQHTMTIESSHLAELRAYNKSRSRWGSEPITAPSALTLVDIGRHIRETGAVVVPLAQEAASAAVKDQIMQTGPASIKADVKTGAADSAWLRSIHKHNGDSFEGLLIVSGDSKALVAIGEALHEEIQSVSSTRHISNLLEPAVPAPHQLSALSSALKTALKDGDVVDVEWAWVFDQVTALGSDELPEGKLQWQLQSSEYTFVDEDEVTNPQMDPWSHAVTAQAEITVMAEDTYARQNFWGDTPEFAVVNSTALVTVEVQALPNGDGDSLEMVEIDVIRTRLREATSSLMS